MSFKMKRMFNVTMTGDNGLAMGTQQVEAEVIYTITLIQVIDEGTAHFIFDLICLPDWRTVMRNPSDYHDHVRTRGGRFWHYRLPYNLLYRHSFYHGIQHYQFHFPRNGRL